ncbi:MAG: 16S rRNA (cytosine(967)-C(5))-methyltransferase RsmB [Lachnospiraceae bacterium]|nr:16S rRNA (cytosine(967)-C(5))-methyltransferase RsmB [Lachnospiraceae bacterium]
MNKANIRELIVDSLVEMERESLFLSAVTGSVLDKYDHYPARDKAFYKKVMDGTTEQRIRIDYILDLFLSKPVNKLKPYIRAILRMSVYQLLWMDSVPDRAVCSEAVSIVSSRGLSGLKGFVNGVLRNIARNKDNISYPDRDVEPIRFLSVFYSWPEWTVRYLTDTYGIDTAEGILRASIDERPLSVRLRTSSEADTADLEKRWQDAGIVFMTDPYLPYMRRLEDYGSVKDIPGFTEGMFVIQDTASAFVSQLGVSGDESLILDLCAAPGGKSIHAADVLCKLKSDPNAELCKHDSSSGFRIVSCDISPDRCVRIRENIDRLGLGDHMIVREQDATVSMEEFTGRADTVIADVPCSGLGVAGHKPDIKYRVTPDDIDSLVSIQRRITDRAVDYVRPGGTLVYSTCTLMQSENSEQAACICDRYGFEDITSDLIADRLPDIDPGLADRSRIPGLPGIQILPGVWDTDGFYIAVLRKR